MKYSILIPARNSEATLPHCLDSVLELRFSDENFIKEIIVVDDASQDKTVQIADRPECRVIKLPKNLGRAEARNIGAQHATEEILVFVDSDIVIPANSLERVSQHFLSHPEAIAANGILSADVHGLNFFSDYKNLYMNYHLKQNPDFIDFIFSSFVAIKKEYFLPFKPYQAADDTELGIRMTAKYGKRILLAKDIEVKHLKRYTFWGLLKNDFGMASYWALILKHRKGFLMAIQERQFAHARSSQLFSLGFVGASLLCLALMIATPKVGALGYLLFLAAALLTRAGYFNFIFKKRGLGFLFKTLPLFYIDSIAHLTGAIWGVLVCREKIQGKIV